MCVRHHMLSAVSVAEYRWYVKRVRADGADRHTEAQQAADKRAVHASGMMQRIPNAGRTSAPYLSPSTVSTPNAAAVPYTRAPAAASSSPHSAAPFLARKGSAPSKPASSTSSTAWVMLQVAIASYWLVAGQTGWVAYARVRHRSSCN